MIRFNLDKGVQLSYYEQIKGQLLSAIYCGKINPGDKLPSIRELAEALDVNYKTIRNIYQRLAQEKYIEIIKGSGAFLQERSGENTYDKMRRRAIFRLLSDTVEKARQLGVPPSRLVHLLDGFVTGNNLRKLRLAVVDDEEEALVFSRELKERLKADVVPLSLNRIDSETAQEQLRDVEYILTTSWHMEQVAVLASRVRRPLLEIKPSHAIYQEVLANAKNRNIAIVIKDEKTMHASWDVFMNIFHPSTQKKFWIAPLNRQDLIEEIIREADLIFVSPMCWDEMRKRTPADRELKTYENFISEETVSHLRELQLLG
ncbi:MAG TPA: GntR family transcriptional regulator [Acidobacteriota bacterium]|nr:GntR family transcriptional regulator [Acidobacteriota bacterium]